MFDYPFTVTEVLNLLGIYPDTAHGDYKMVCPFCGSKKASKKMWINLDKGMYHCWAASCPARAGNIVDFYAKARDLEWNEAYREIKKELRLENTDPNHVKERKITIRKREIEAEPVLAEENIADIEKRHLWYSLLLTNSRCKLKAEHLQNLVNRGFDEETAKILYSSVPCSDNYEYFKLTAQLQKETASDPDGVPGFFMSQNNKWVLSYLQGGIMIPIINFNKKIQVIAVRIDDENRRKDDYGDYIDGKFTYLTSNNKNRGCKAHSFIHYACDFKYDEERRCMIPVIPNQMIVLIEGPMKADLFYHLTGQSAIAVSGVDNLKYLKGELEKLKSICGIQTVLNGYDMDYLTNPNVQMAQEKAKNIIKELGLNYSRITWNTKVNGQDVLKGIDDHYAYKFKGIVPVLKMKNAKINE